MGGEGTSGRRRWRRGRSEKNKGIRRRQHPVRTGPRDGRVRRPVRSGRGSQRRGRQQRGVRPEGRQTDPGRGLREHRLEASGKRRRLPPGRIRAGRTRRTGQAGKGSSQRAPPSRGWERPRGRAGRGRAGTGRWTSAKPHRGTGSRAPAACGSSDVAWTRLAHRLSWRVARSHGRAGSTLRRRDGPRRRGR